MEKKDWEERFIQTLKEAYEQHREINPRFSLRAFAKKIGVASGTLTVILNRKKKWQISAERAAEIIEKLNLSPSVKNSLFIQMGVKPVIVPRRIEQGDYPILLDWTYQPILMFFTLPIKKRDSKHIAKALGIDEAKVDSVVSDALSRGLLVKDSCGRIERPEEFLTSTDGPSSEVIRKHHKLNLDMAARSLNEQPPELRDFTSFTFSGDGKKLRLLAKEIRDLYHKASAIMNGGPDNDKVFRLSIQLFPMEFHKNESH